jgi:membrane protein insertase Oxa1/YidC/SpoIIIJ
MQQTTGTSAVASLVLGIIALVTLLTAGVFYGCLPLPLILGILAWIFGKNAMNAIDAGVGNPNERGMAVAGYIMGILSVVLSVLGLCCVGGAIAGVIGLSAAPFWGQWQFQF